MKLGALHIRVASDSADVESAWQHLEAHGLCTYFQTRAWCLAWAETVGPVIAARPLYVTGTDEQGRITFLLPLQLRRKFGMTLLEFLTAPHATYGFGLFDTDFLQAGAAAWFAEHFSALLALLPAHDVVYLRDIPDRMLGHPNPLSPLARIKGANHAFMMKLDTDFENLLSQRRGPETLRSMRKRDKRLVAMGNLTFGAPATAAERHRILAQMFSDHELRLAETGVHGIYGPIERGFLSDLTDPAKYGHHALIPYALCLDGTPLCVLLGGRACNTFWAMITSLADGPWRKHSPGDYTLRHVIAAQCADGLPWFDFAAGLSDYKLAWADTEIELNLLLQSSGLRGLPATMAIALKHGTKRLLKGNAALRNLVFTLRRLLRGRRVAE